MDNPSQYDRVLIDVCRIMSGPYQLSWLADLSDYTIMSLQSVVMQLLMQGKHITLYCGGTHGTDLDVMRSRFSSGRGVDYCVSLVRRIGLYHDHPKVFYAFDGSGGGETEARRETRSAFCHALCGRGYKVVVEGYAFPGRTISDFPSLSTLALLIRHPFPLGYGSQHGVLVSNGEGLEMVPAMRRQGRAVYLGAGAIGTGEPLPEWWGGTIIG